MGHQGKARSRSARLRLDSSVRRSIKVVLIGDSQSGKTSLRNRWLTGRFSSNYSATIGVDFLTKSLPLYPDVTPSESKATISCWDTAGQERFRSISSSFYRGADAVIIQFDASTSDPDQQKERIRFWYQEFSKMAPVEGKEEVRRFTWVVVGGKADLIGVDPAEESLHTGIQKFLDDLLPRKHSGESADCKQDPANQDLMGTKTQGYDLLDDGAEVSSDSAIKSRSLLTSTSDKENREPLDGSEPPAPPREVLSRPDPSQTDPPIFTSASSSSSSNLNSSSTPTSRKNSIFTQSKAETPRPRHKSLSSAKKALSNRKSIKSIDVINPTDSDDEFRDSWKKNLTRAGSKASGRSSVSKSKSFHSRPSDQEKVGQHRRNESLDSSPSFKSNGGLSAQSGQSNSIFQHSIASGRDQRQRFDSTISQISTSESIYHTPRNSTYFSSSSLRDDQHEEEADATSNFSFPGNGSPSRKSRHKSNSSTAMLEKSDTRSNGFKSLSTTHLKSSDARNLNPTNEHTDDSNSAAHRNSLALSDKSSTPTLKVRKDDLNGGGRTSGVNSDEGSEPDDGLSTPKLEKDSNPLIDDMILRSSSGKDRHRELRGISHMYEDLGTGMLLNVGHDHEDVSENEVEEEIGIANPILSGDPIPFPTTEDVESEAESEEEGEREREDGQPRDEELNQNEDDWKDIPIRRSNLRLQEKGNSRDRGAKARDASDPFSTLNTIPPSEMDEQEIQDMEDHLRSENYQSDRRSRILNGKENTTSSAFLRSRNNSSVHKGKGRAVEIGDGDEENDSDPEPILSEGFSLIYTSSKTGLNVSKVFETVVERVVGRWELEEWEERERTRMRRKFITNADKRKSTAGDWNFSMNDLGRQSGFGPPLGFDEESRREAVRRGIRIAAGKDQNPRGGWRSCC